MVLLCHQPSVFLCFPLYVNGLHGSAGALSPPTNHQEGNFTLQDDFFMSEIQETPLES